MKNHKEILRIFRASRQLGRDLKEVYVGDSSEVSYMGQGHYLVEHRNVFYHYWLEDNIMGFGCEHYATLDDCYACIMYAKKNN
jgi:hypothetical protein